MHWKLKLRPEPECSAVEWRGTPFATKLDGVDEFGPLAGEGPVVHRVVAAQRDEAALRAPNTVQSSTVQYNRFRTDLLACTLVYSVEEAHSKMIQRWIGRRECGARAN